MKRIEISNREVRLGYELADLSPEALERALSDAVDFEMEVMTEDSDFFYLVEEMERMQTPWFLGEAIMTNHREDLLEVLTINEYLFDEDGDILPILHYVDDHPEAGKIVYGKKQIPCIITQI